MAVSRGYHFFQNPGPTNIPDRVLRAMDRGAIDFTGAQFKAIAEECFAGLKRVFKTEQTILAYTASGHGAWEAALVNLFSPGDKVLVVESGYFSLNWGMRCEAFGLEVETLANDWRSAADPAKLESRLREDRGHAIKAVLVVHNETSTGVVNDIAALAPRDRRRRTSGAVPGRRDLVPGVDGFPHGRMGRRRRRRRLAEGTDAADRHGLYRGQRSAPSPPAPKPSCRASIGIGGGWSARASQAVWNGTAPVHFFYGLQEALRMIEEEGLDNVFARHHRLAEATRRAVRVWRQNDGPEIFAVDPRAQSDSVTAVLTARGL